MENATVKVRLTLDKLGDLSLDELCQWLSDSPSATCNVNTVMGTGERIPTLWAQYNWDRAYELLVADEPKHECVEGARGYGVRRAPSVNLAPEDVDVLLARTSRRFFSNRVVSRTAWNAVTKTLLQIRDQLGHLRPYCVVQGVEGLERYAVLRLGRDGWEDTNRLASRGELLRVLQGMWWLSGGGAAVFLSVDWAAAEARYGCEIGAYLETMIDMGRACQLALGSIYRNGLGGWMTPAVDEGAAQELLGLEGRVEEVLYCFKFGQPRRGALEGRYSIDQVGTPL